MLGSQFAMFVAWGEDGILIYNDAYAAVLGTRHPSAVGQPMREVWPEIWSEIEPLVNAAMRGESLYHENLPLTLHRLGYPEDTWWTFSYSPVREGEDARIAGMVCTCIETTTSVLAERREGIARARLNRERHSLEVLNQTASSIATDHDIESVVQKAVDAGVELSNARFGAFFYNVLAENGERMMLYALSGADQSDFESFGMPRMTGIFAPTFRGHATLRSDDVLRDSRYGSHGGMPVGHLPVRSYLAVPVMARSGEVIGSLLFGHPEPNQFDDHAEQVVETLAAQAAACIENLRLFQATQRDNETLEQEVTDRTAERDYMWRFTPDLMLIADYTSTIEAINPAWMSVLGYTEEELIGKPFLPLVHPDWRAPTLTEMSRLTRGETVLNFENHVLHKDGSVRTILWTAVPNESNFQTIGRDITAERAAARALALTEDQLRQSQKMEAVGQLTGGVAHDFNNLLTVIKSSVDLLKRPDLPVERRDRYIGAISDTVDRAAKLTGQLLAFARRQALKPEVFDVGKSLTTLHDMLKTLTGSRIRIEMNLPADTHAVNADPIQFDTAIVNMAVNARDAIDGDGHLMITLSCVDEVPALRGHAAVPGRYVAVALTDTGAGIPEDRLERVFEPFFTTKSVGQGTGLGLSQVFGFAKQSGGEIGVESRVGEGTTFTLYLPRVISEVTTAQRDEPASLVDGHGTRVLVVEDNADVGQFAMQALSELGYKTVWTMNAEEALKEIERSGCAFDIVFSDVVMPGMNGIDLARTIRQAHPSLPIVLTSGYSDVLAQQGSSGFDLLQKPYSVEQLSRILRGAVQAR